MKGRERDKSKEEEGREGGQKRTGKWKKERDTQKRGKEGIEENGGEMKGGKRCEGR